jgi:hypothetical protein
MESGFSETNLNSENEPTLSVFQQMRQQLDAIGIRTSDVRTSIRGRAQI